MNRNLVKQIKLAKGEKIYYDFNKLKGKNNDARIVLTTNRIIIYNDGIYYEKKRKIRRKGINEIERDTITHIEYYLEYRKSSQIAKFIGLIVLIAGALLALLNFDGYEALPYISSSAFLISGRMILIQDAFYYGIAAIFIITALIVIFKAKKTLFFRVVSGHVDDYTIELKKNKYNEEAIRRLSTKLYIK
jgi:hypothetical protein